MSSVPRSARRLLFFLASLLGRWLLGLYYLTVRIVPAPGVIRRLNRVPHPSGIYAFWHAHQISVAWCARNTRSAILVSQSADGEYIARIARALGYRVVRGSSSRGGIGAFKGMIAAYRQGGPIAITPDGPRGPRQKIKPGILMLAKNTGAPVVPTAVGISAFWEIPSWDRFRIPKPFSHGHFCFGEPILVPPDADDAVFAILAVELERRMIALEAHADKVASGAVSVDPSGCV